MTLTAIAIIVTPHTGAYGNHANPRIALTPAITTPTVRASTDPVEHVAAGYRDQDAPHEVDPAPLRGVEPEHVLTGANVNSSLMIAARSSVRHTPQAQLSQFGTHPCPCRRSHSVVRRTALGTGPRSD